MEKWKTNHSEQLINNRWIKVRKDAVELPNGQKNDDFYQIWQSTTSIGAMHRMGVDECLSFSY